MAKEKLDLLQGTLDVMVLRTLEALGPRHGYGIARRIEQVSGNQVLLNQGTIYASLVRLQFYSITKQGGKQLAKDARYWERLAGVMGRVLALRAEGGDQ
ncbi:MAG: PadR family transcriptional regulator [Acidobacteria bacterium]|nr:MAG: PadR family transcriptional regulator [Acidobacteriota bacterium]